MVGETIITDADGAILERLAYEDGEGYVCADVAWEEPRPRDPVPPTFWLTSMPVSVHAIWYAENARGRLHYVTKKALAPAPVPARPRLRPRPAVRHPGRRGPGRRREVACGAMGRAWTVMGVVNVTPDSFSDGGLWLDAGAAIDHGVALLAAGRRRSSTSAASRRGPAPSRSPRRRSCAASSRSLAGLRERARGAVLSIDTSKLAVARAALGAGATYVNDVTAFRHDPADRGARRRRRAATAASCTCRASRARCRRDPRYDDVVDDVARVPRAAGGVRGRAGRRAGAHPASTRASASASRSSTT